MSSNPQWNEFQPPSMNNDYKTINNLADEHLSYRSYNGPLQSSTQNKESGNGVFGKSTGSNSQYGYNSYNGSSAMSFPIGTFSANERSTTSTTTNHTGNSFNMNGGDIFSTSAISNVPGLNLSGSSSQFNTSNDSNSGNHLIRETGIIEKLLHSYGFIQCCERQARLFFHFSQFNGNIEHLKIGDPVEFEMTYDRRTGKPIASAVSKIAPEVVMSEERVTGIVTTEIKSEGTGAELQGRISYENRGECFFLPYNKDDVEGNVTLRSGDKVSFQIAANQRGNLGACHIRLENPAHPVKYQGVICSMKESFGFIERADIVKEIFFHFSEAKVASADDLHLGDDVQFIIQTRNGKEVACNITTLEPGSVVFEDVCTEIVRGQVLKPLERGQHARQQDDPLPGRIRYRAPDHSEVEIPFGEKDQRGDFTLRHGDWVQFRIATDRRDQLQRATNISLLEESFLVSGERREQGIVISVKEGFGFIKCADRDLRVFFHFNEVLDVDHEPQQDDEVEFTIVQDSLSSYSNNRQSAIRMKLLPPGSVQFETLVEEKVSGVVTKEPQPPAKSSPSKSPTNGERQPEPGTINYQQGDVKKTISFYYKPHGPLPRVGDKVEFNIVQVKRNKELLAVDVALVGKGQGPSTPQSSKISNGIPGPTTPSTGPRSPPCQGFIAALKDGFGFIETISHDHEVFFHFSNLEGDAEKLELGQEVEYNLGSKGSSGSCLSAENVRLLSRGTIPPAVSQGALLDGSVVRPLRCVNPDQSQYAGLIQAVAEQEGEHGGEYEFGITSLVNKRELLQAGDPVQFYADSEGRAAGVVAVRKKRKAMVDAVKGQFGFLAFEVEEGKKLFFHMSEVKDGVSLQPGDTVEFSLVTNQRNGKSSACSVIKLSDNQQRPERLISRLRTISLEDGGPKLTVVRQPRGPDGTKGFSSEARSHRPAGAPILE